MSTVDKALSVLDLFSESRPNMGTSEIARQLGWDKSNVQRYVSDLAARGILEQDSRDRTYYLGPALTRLAIVRNRTHPVAGEIQRVLNELVDETGETAHASGLVGGDLITNAVVETKIRGTRVYVDPAEPLPFHASGSGIAFLSRSSADRVESILSGTLARFTPKTPISRSQVMSCVKSARRTGYAKLSGSFERDVVGVAAPIVGFDGTAIGAIAVAAPIARFDASAEKTIVTGVVAAARRVSQMHGAA